MLAAYFNSSYAVEPKYLLGTKCNSETLTINKILRAFQSFKTLLTFAKQILQVIWDIWKICIGLKYTLVA